MTSQITQMMQNMIKETINQLEQNGGLKISVEEAFALFEMEAPKKVSKGGHPGRPAMTKGEKVFKKLVKGAHAQEKTCVKKAFKFWSKGVNTKKKAAAKEAAKAAAKEQKDAEKAAAKEQKVAEKAAAKEQKEAEKASAKEQKAAAKEQKAAEKEAAKNKQKALAKADREQKAADKALAKAEREAEDAIAALTARPRGRSPKGKVWDDSLGEWISEISLAEDETVVE